MTLQEMRETWRPKLAHDVVWMCRLILPADVALILFRPETAPHVVALTLAVFGFACTLFGIRQWGKNAGVSENG